MIFGSCLFFCKTADNNCMNIYGSFNKLKNSMLIPFGLTAIIYVFKALFDFLAYKIGDEIVSFSNLSSCLNFFALLEIAFFVTFYLSKGSKALKALFALFCTFVFCSIFTQSKSLLFALLISLLTHYCFENLKGLTAMLLTLLSVLIIAVLCTYLYDYYINVVMALASAVSDKGNLSSALFGFINTIFSPIDFSNFENMFYFKSFGSTSVDGNNIISGAVNLFQNNIKSNAVTAYLSGHSFVIFLSVGIFAKLVKKLKGLEKLMFCVIFTSLILCGNINLFMLFVLLESPFLFLSACVLAGLCYFCAAIVKISVGFAYGGGIIEILINCDKYVYLVALGTVFVAIGYFVTEYFYEKYGVSSMLNTYIPKWLEKTVASLGGIQNIIRLYDDIVEVRNPKLVDELSLDCKVNENNITLEQDLISDLKEYIS